MRRILAAVVGLVASAGVTAAAHDDGPELTPPAVAGPVAETPGNLPKVVESVPASASPATPAPVPGNGAVLVVPGVNTPRARGRVQGNGRTTVSRVPWADDAQPPLVGPSEMREDDVLPPPIPAGPPASGMHDRAPDGRPPLTLESVPAGDDKDGPTSAGPSPRRTPPEPRIRPMPRRPGGLFGRFLPPNPAARNRGLVTVEPPTDPASDEAIRKRVDRQVRDGLGTALKSYEIRVVGGEITVHARAARFWQKRAVRNALEGLPALKGTGARVEVVD